MLSLACDTRHPAGTRLSLEHALVYVVQVASALQYAHDQRLIHRDVKPENMLLDAREQLLLADFGLALLLPTYPASTQVLDPALAGTAPYLAPEQVQGQPGPASDQYALGVVVYEWLCGQRPFRGTPIEVAMQHVSAPPPPFYEQAPDLPPPSRRSSCVRWPKSQRSVSPPCRTLPPPCNTLLIT